MTFVLEKRIPFSEQRFVQRGIAWSQFKSIQVGFAEAPGVRLFYYQEALEILAVSPEHERVKGAIGYLIETYLIERGIEFEPTGNFNQEREREASVQADESYCLGSLKPIPDLSVEVVMTSGGPDKLKRYRALGVPEVWFWEDRVFSLYCLREDGYEPVTRSEQLPGLDMQLLTRCVIMASRVEAAREFRRALGEASGDI